MTGTPRTFRSRLAFSTAILSIGVLSFGGIAVYLRLSQALRANLDQALLGIARAELASALDGPHGKVHVHDEKPLSLKPGQAYVEQEGLLGIAGAGGYEKLARIWDDKGKVVAQTENVATGPAFTTSEPMRREADKGGVVFGNVRRGEAEYRAIYYPFRNRLCAKFVAVVAIPKTPVTRSLNELTLILLATLTIGGVGAAFGSYLLATRLTRPLEAIAAAASGIAERGLEQRIPDTAPDTELRQVTGALNQMLERLHSAFRRQEELIESQRRFVADASHELRSPLSNLRGTVEVALRRPRSAEEYRETLSLSLEEIERLSRLTADLLTLSRADAGRFSVERAPIDLCRVAELAVRAHAARAREMGLSVRLEAMDPAPVEGDLDRLRQVADNLLDNALRHSPAGAEVVMTVTVLGSEAVLSVRDRGPGLAAADAERLFERFYRADSSRARHSGGAGLGLAIARVIAEAHGGRVWVRTAPGEGAEFSLALPLTATVLEHKEPVAASKRLEK